MKDIVISAKRQRTELWIALACFIVANILNIWAITAYHAPFSEVYTAIFYVLVFTVVLYGITVLVRLLVWGVTKLVTPRHKPAVTSKKQ